MANRREQIALLISTLRHFGCEDEKIDFRFMEGYKHCQYNEAVNENGNSIFANLIYDFISKQS